MIQAEKTIEDAEELLENGKHEEAMEKFGEAVDFVPGVFEDNPLAGRIITGIGDARYYREEYELAAEAYEDVLMVVDMAANPYVRLRRGQIYLALNNQEKAGVELACAYMNGGVEVFEGEDEKYINIVRELLPNENI